MPNEFNIKNGFITSGNSFVYANVNFGTGFTWNNTNSRLGIGTNSPSASLQVVGGGVFSSSINISGGFVMTEAGNVHLFTAPATNRTIRFVTNSQSFSLTPTGNVQIGTTTDAGYKLDVNGTGRFTDNLLLSTNKGVYFGSSGYGVSGETGIGTVSLVTNSINRLRIDNSGNINASSSPTAQFSNIYITGSNIEFWNGLHYFSWENTGNVFQIKNISNGNTIPFIVFKSTNNIGIGAITDSGFKLDVSGNTRIQGGLTANTISATTATIRRITGGSGNTNSGTYSFIGGGTSNTSTGNLSLVGGGRLNTSSGNYSFIGGGSGNTASSYYSFVGGGLQNISAGIYSTVSAGYKNCAISYGSTVGGGSYNVACGGKYSTVGGGTSNTASGPTATISGGYGNIASGSNSIVGGGYTNTASCNYSFVGGGRNNTTSGYHSTVSGGYSNTSSNYYSTVGGGASNTASGDRSTVSGGLINAASGGFSTVAGGATNTASGIRSTVSGGYGNTSSGYGSTVGGGNNNTATGDTSFVAGGYLNVACGGFSFIGAGKGNTVSGTYSAAIGCGLNATASCTLYTNNSFATTAMYSPSFSGSVSTISGSKGSVITSGSTTTAFMTFCGSNTIGGTGYTDFIRVTNTAAGATNPNKTIRMNNTGGLEIVNSAYNSTPLTLSDSGNLSVAGTVTANAWSAGQVIKDTILSNTEVTVSTTTIATSNADTDFVTYSYTPTSSNSYLIIHYHLASYDFTSGTGNDSYFSRIKVDGNEITFGAQNTVNGFRTGVLFPLTGRYTNSNTTAKSIVVACRRNSADDSISIVNSSTSMWLRITEIAR